MDRSGHTGSARLPSGQLLNVLPALLAMGPEGSKFLQGNCLQLFLEPEKGVRDRIGDRHNFLISDDRCGLRHGLPVG